MKDKPIELFPYKGIYGKCGNYFDVLDKDCLCEMCVWMGVKRIAPIPDIILQFVKPRF
jgi:hypothetical protein